MPPGPCEIGIFYYRFPAGRRGAAFSPSPRKSFPKSSATAAARVEQLIRADARAAIMAATYLKRHHAIRGKVLAAGQRLKLVEAGNHCQGCIFRDGMHLWSEAAGRPHRPDFAADARLLHRPL